MKTNMQCQQFEKILEQQDDGPLPEPALDHIDACQACRTLLADFGAIHEVAVVRPEAGLCRDPSMLCRQ